MAIFLLTAPSGAGKTTIAQNIQNRGYWDECISHTTREMREGEVDGKTYYYVSKDEFKQMFDNGEFAEQVSYDGNYYGIAKSEIERVLSKGKHVLVIVEYGGYLQMKEKYPNAIGIFMYMSKEDCLANMLLRGDSLEKAMKRIETYDKEMANRLDYDYIIKNVRDKQSHTESIITSIASQYNKSYVRNSRI